MKGGVLAKSHLGGYLNYVLCVRAVSHPNTIKCGALKTEELAFSQNKFQNCVLKTPFN